MTDWDGLTIARKWALRHKATGWWMPQLTPTSTKGGTYAEPYEGAEPRLFHSKKAAKIFLTVWCKGHHYTHKGSGAGDWFSSGSDDVGGVDVEHVPGRWHRDFEIVELAIVEVPKTVGDPEPI